ncbi:MAG: hypothetical protein QW680_05840 [Pyrobaculum sp.]
MSCNVDKLSYILFLSTMSVIVLLFIVYAIIGDFLAYPLFAWVISAVVISTYFDFMCRRTKIFKSTDR